MAERRTFHASSSAGGRAAPSKEGGPGCRRDRGALREAVERVRLQEGKGLHADLRLPSRMP